MRRVHYMLSICAALLCGSVVAAYAGRVQINVDMNNPALLVDVNIVDADVSQVLTTLFNSTQGKYQVQVGLGVTDTIDNLQFAQKPFEEALKAIIAKANTNYTVEKSGDTLFQISSGLGSGISLLERKVDKKDVKAKSDDIKIIGPIKLPKLVSATATDPALTSMTSVGASATEESYLAMITINNISAVFLAQDFGFSFIPTYNQLSNTNGSSGGNISSNSSGNGSTRNNQSSRNNNNHNNSYNSSNGNYSSNNRSSRGGSNYD